MQKFKFLIFGSVIFGLASAKEVVFENDVAKIVEQKSTAVEFAPPSIFLVRPVVSPFTVIPFQIAAGDFNGDLKPDIATPYTVLLNNGIGGLVLQNQTLYGGKSFGVVAGDMNRDGNVDLIITDRTSYSGNGSLFDSNIYVHRGNGNGTFATPPQISGTNQSSPYVLTTGDFNNDGILDVVTSNLDEGNIILRLGRGDGSLYSPPPPFYYPSGQSPQSRPYFFATGHFNSDNNLDIAVSNAGENSISVWLGNGDGTLTRVLGDFSAHGKPTGLVSADMNSDGKADLIVANEAGDDISVLLGSGSGIFGSPVSYPAGDEPFSVAVAYFNDDTYPDVAVTNLRSDTVGVFLGTSAGTLRPQVTFATIKDPTALIVADMNSDGRQDIVVSSYSEDQVAVLLNITKSEILFRDSFEF